MSQSDQKIPLKRYKFADLFVGMSASMEVTIEESDISTFAKFTHDYNPIHVDESAAKTAGFPSNVSHGMLVTSYVSTIVGMLLPGDGALIGSTTFNYRQPVFKGDKIFVSGKVAELIESVQSAMLSIVILVGDKVVVDGSVLVRVP